MTNTSLQYTAAVFAAVLTLSTGASWAAKAPMSSDNRAKEATNIVSGKVLNVTSKVQASAVEQAMGFQRDRVFTMTVQVLEVTKGDGIAINQKIEIVAWQPETRMPTIPGLQGQDTIPKTGDSATFYLKAGGGKPLQPLLPNGIVIK